MAVLKKKKGKQSQKVTKVSKDDVSSDGAAQSQIRQGRVTAHKLNLRREPSEKSPKVDVLKKGTVVNILGSEGEWLQIEHGGKGGFAHSRFIEAIETTETPIAITGTLSGSGTLKATLETMPSETPDYQQQFLALLNNRPDPSTSEKPRSTGFVALVSGTTDLKEFEELCFSSRQSWNRCLTVRYQYPASKKTYPEAISQFGLDITFWANVLKGIPRGNFRDDGSFTWKVWAQRELFLSKSWESLLRSLGSALNTGERLVIFLELTNASEIAKVEDIGLDNISPDHSLRNLHPRIGIVVSGVPENIAFPTGGPHFERISVSADPKLDLSYGQAFANDSPTGPDRLNIEAEVYALAETISLKDMKPPLVVGILGGWGWGKSFVLKLLEERIAKIRCHDLTSYKDNLDKFPYVGHPYVIRFDAWTYAKSSLWASLMQTILLELNRQIGLEQALDKLKEISLLKGGPVWQLLSGLSDKQRKDFLENDLGKKALDQEKEFSRGKVGGEALWERFKQLKDDERKKLLEAEEELATRQHELESAKADIEAKVDEKLQHQAKWAAWEQVLDELMRIGYEKSEVDNKSEKDPPTFKEIEEKIKKIKFLPKKLWVGVGTAPLAFLVFGIVAVVAELNLESVKNGVGWLGGVVGVVVSVMNSIRRANTWLEEKNRKYQSRVTAASERLNVQREQMIRKLVSEQDESYRKERQKGETAASESRSISELEENIRKLEIKVEDHRRNVGTTAGYDSLLDFVKGRIASGYYDEKLGLLHQVQKDLNELTDALLLGEGAAQLFPRRAPRIILIVDDLDRCPPERVVEVLEAAQLLVKTELFVLVLAMDIRYITRALEKTYKGVLIRNGDPSGLDYIEKIVQVPYRVRPIQPSAMANFLGDQMSFEEPPSTDGEKPKKEKELDTKTMADAQSFYEPGMGQGASYIRSESTIDKGAETQVLVTELPMTIRKFELDELNLLEACCNAVVMSPRAAKRIVNVFKLLKIIWERRGLESGPKRAVKQAMLLMLALVARHPDVMCGLLRDLEEKFRKEKNPRGTLKAFLTKRCEMAIRTPLSPLNWQRVIGLLNDKSLLSTTLKLADVGADNIMLVSSFSFVGEGKTDSRQRKPAGNNRVPSNGQPKP